MSSYETMRFTVPGMLCLTIVCVHTSKQRSSSLGRVDSSRFFNYTFPARFIEKSIQGAPSCKTAQTPYSQFSLLEYIKNPKELCLYDVIVFEKNVQEKYEVISGTRKITLLET